MEIYLSVYGIFLRESNILNVFVYEIYKLKLYTYQKSEYKPNYKVSILRQNK